MVNPRWGLKRKLEAAIDDNVRLRAENKRLRSYVAAAVAHARLARTENEKLRQRLFSKAKRKKTSVTLPPGARYLNSADGRQKHLQDLAEKHQRDQEKENRQRARQERDREDALRRAKAASADDDTCFTGALSSKNKSDLRVIAAALHIAFDAKHTKKDLANAIVSYLTTNEGTLRHNRRFSGLYPQPRKSSGSASQPTGYVASPANNLDTFHPAPVYPPMPERAGQPQLDAEPGSGDPIQWSVDPSPATPSRRRLPLQTPSPHTNRVTFRVVSPIPNADFHST